MNAYEMSDELLRDNTQLTVKAAYMLRQQADRIVELEKECHWAKDQWDKDRICFKARIAELEKELYFKNYYEELPDTPVGIYTTPQKYCPTENNAAYEKGVIDGMAKQRQSRVDGIIGQIGDSPIHDLVHRTTPQIKELSDEEIYELWCESDNTELLPEMRNKDGSINYIILTFAELLLKKTSEK